MFALSGIDKILEKIRQDSNEKETGILDAARKEAEQTIRDAKVKAEDFLSVCQKTAEQEMAFLKSQRESQRKARAKQMLLQEKRNQIDKSFVLARDTVLNLPLPKYERFMESLLTGEESGGELLLSEKDCKRLEKSDFAKKLRHKNLRLSKEFLKEDGGFMIRREKVMINKSLSSLFSEQKAGLEPKLAEILFEEGMG